MTSGELAPRLLPIAASGLGQAVVFVNSWPHFLQRYSVTMLGISTNLTPAAVRLGPVLREGLISVLREGIVVARAVGLVACVRISTTWPFGNPHFGHRSLGLGHSQILPRPPLTRSASEGERQGRDDLRTRRRWRSLSRLSLARASG